MSHCPFLVSRLVQCLATGPFGISSRLPYGCHQILHRGNLPSRAKQTRAISTIPLACLVYRPKVHAGKFARPTSRFGSSLHKTIPYIRVEIRIIDDELARSDCFAKQLGKSGAIYALLFCRHDDDDESCGPRVAQENLTCRQNMNRQIHDLTGT